MNVNNNNDYEIHDDISISKQAENFEMENHLQPHKFECNPKFKSNDHKQGVKFIQEFLRLITNDFRKQNSIYSKPLGFETWWIDRNGDIQAITNEIDLYVYLCNEEHIPKEIEQIKITLHLPKHFSPQRSIMLKWVSYLISIEDMSEELNMKFESIYYRLLQALGHKIGIHHIFSSTYHPQSNGMIERFNATFIPQIAKLQDSEYNNW
ncbi:unnamed protein product, partial [Didymodactylos carnosus]